MGLLGKGRYLLRRNLWGENTWKHIRGEMQTWVYQKRRSLENQRLSKIGYWYIN